MHCTVHRCTRDGGTSDGVWTDKDCSVYQCIIAVNQDCIICDRTHRNEKLRLLFRTERKTVVSTCVQSELGLYYARQQMVDFITVKDIHMAVNNIKNGARINKDNTSTFYRGQYLYVRRLRCPHVSTLNQDCTVHAVSEDRVWTDKDCSVHNSALLAESRRAMDPGTAESLLSVTQNYSHGPIHTPLIYGPTSAKEVMFYRRFVCLFLCQQLPSKTTYRILVKILQEFCLVTSTK